MAATGSIRPSRARRVGTTIAVVITAALAWGQQALGDAAVQIKAVRGVDLRAENGVYIRPLKSDSLAVEPRLREAFKRAGFKVVTEAPQYFVPSYGTGFVVDRQGLVVTNNHVVREAGRPELRFQDGRVFPARLVQRDPANDLALLEPEQPAGAEFAPLRLGDSSKVWQGAKVYSLGFPIVSMLGAQSHWGEGVVGSTSGLKGDPRHFEISVPTQPGSSGSPLFNHAGEVVGVVSSVINAQKFMEATGGKAIPQNLNFAIKIEHARSLVARAGRNPDASAGAIDVANPTDANRSVMLVKMLPPPEYEARAGALPLRADYAYGYRRSTMILDEVKLSFWDPVLNRVVLTVQARNPAGGTVDQALDRLFDALKAHLGRRAPDSTPATGPTSTP